MKKIMIFIMACLLLTSAYAIPQKDINFLDLYSLFDLYNLTSNYIYLNNSLVCTAKNGLCGTGGGNTSWNQSLADSLYSQIGTGGNNSWNESLANSMYVPYTGANQTVNLGDNNLIVNLSSGSGDYFQVINTSGTNKFKVNNTAISVFGTSFTSTTGTINLVGANSPILTGPRIQTSYGGGSSTSFMEFYATTATPVTTGGYFTWNTNVSPESEKMKLTNLGRLGIGTSNPDYSLTVNGSGVNISNLSSNAVLCLNGNCVTTLSGVGDNTSWNESFANTLYAPIGVNYTINITNNITTYINTTNNISIENNITNNITVENNITTYVNTTNNITNDYGNSSWNQSYADTIFVPYQGANNDVNLSTNKIIAGENSSLGIMEIGSMNGMPLIKNNQGLDGVGVERILAISSTEYNFQPTLAFAYNDGNSTYIIDFDRNNKEVRNYVLNSSYDQQDDYKTVFYTNITAPNICYSDGINCSGTGSGNASWNQSLTDNLYVPYNNAFSNVNLNYKNLTGINWLLFNGSKWGGGRVWYVPCGFDIQTAINMADSEDTLQLGSCVYIPPSDLLIAKSITIQGLGTESTQLGTIVNITYHTFINITTWHVVLKDLSIFTFAPIAIENSPIYSGIIGNNALSNVNIDHVGVSQAIIPPEMNITVNSSNIITIDTLNADLSLEHVNIQTFQAAANYNGTSFKFKETDSIGNDTGGGVGWDAKDVKIVNYCFDIFNGGLTENCSAIAVSLEDNVSDPDITPSFNCQDCNIISYGTDNGIALISDGPQADITIIGGETVQGDVYNLNGGSASVGLNAYSGTVYGGDLDGHVGNGEFFAYNLAAIDIVRAGAAMISPAYCFDENCTKAIGYVPDSDIIGSEGDWEINGSVQVLNNITTFKYCINDSCITSWDNISVNGTGNTSWNESYADEKYVPYHGPLFDFENYTLSDGIENMSISTIVGGLVEENDTTHVLATKDIFAIIAQPYNETADTGGISGIMSGTDGNQNINYQFFLPSNGTSINQYFMMVRNYSDDLQPLYFLIYGGLYTTFISTQSINTNEICLDSGCITSWNNLNSTGNTSWNQSYANTLYAPLGSNLSDNSSWNETYANTKYVPYTGANQNIELNGKKLSNISQIEMATCNASSSSNVALGQQTTASGTYSLATGIGSVASGYASMALGFNTLANGSYGTSIGTYTKATGQFSTAMGWYSEANGAYSTAMGYSTQANGNNSVAMGNLMVVNANDQLGMGGTINATGTIYSSVGFCYNNGTCLSSGGSGGNTSWNESYATSLFTTNTSALSFVNASGYIKDWNQSGYIKNWDPNGYIKDWNSSGYIQDYNTSGYIKDWNQSGFIKNWNASGMIINQTAGIIQDNTSWNENRGNILYYEIANDNATIISMVNLSGYIKNWNQSGYITNWNASGNIINWNQSGFIKNWNGIVNSTSWNRTAAGVILANTNDKVGIGNSSPVNKLDVNGNTSVCGSGHCVTTTCTTSGCIFTFT